MLIGYARVSTGDQQMQYLNDNILSNKKWNNKLTPEDMRALTPLIHAHINPYGLFPLDLAQWLMIERLSQHVEERQDIYKVAV